MRQIFIKAKIKKLKKAFDKLKLDECDDKIMALEIKKDVEKICNINLDKLTIGESKFIKQTIIKFNIFTNKERFEKNRVGSIMLLVAITLPIFILVEKFINGVSNIEIAGMEMVFFSIITIAMFIPLFSDLKEIKSLLKDMKQ
ncbi:hypothetical protein [uncultured Clostridium sp.]|jgi:hypothetical protein|uniref:hypothetical protein n=1 Tax=uncultured Clostridium sp. TaxID=59620 RepID=UPI002603B7C6|nr:hypothetical protein [uncultured Clostridium sp.]